MKNISLFIIFVLFICTSCKKEYACECVFVSQYGYASKSVIYYRESKATAQEKCDARETSFKEDCSLK